VLNFVYSIAEDGGELDPDDVCDDARERAPHVSPAVATHVPEERLHIAQHGSIVSAGIRALATGALESATVS
jgi:hypothetical protein